MRKHCTANKTLQARYTLIFHIVFFFLSWPSFTLSKQSASQSHKNYKESLIFSLVTPCGKIYCLCCAHWAPHASTLKTLKHATVLRRSDLCLPKSPTMALAVLWCAETSSSSFQEISVASPLVCPPTSSPLPYTLLLYIEQAGPLLWLVPSDRSWGGGGVKKGGFVVSLQERWTSFFLLHLFHSQRRGKSEKKNNKEERKRKKCNTVCCGVPPNCQ